MSYLPSALNVGPCVRSSQGAHGHTQSINVSIVLYQTPPAILEHNLVTLGAAVEQARRQGLLGASCVLLADHSPHATDAAIQQRWHELCAPWTEYRYYHQPRNPGYGAGHNTNYAKAPRADLFLVANPDLTFEPHALTGALTFLNEHPDTGVICPALIEQHGPPRPACFRTPDPWTLLLRLMGFDARQSRRIYLYECRDWDPWQPVFHPPLMSGCCLLFRSSVFEQLEGFDPGYFLYFEDFDLSRRAQPLSAYCPNMQVQHLGGGAAQKGWRHRWWFIRSAWRYYRGHLKSDNR